MNRRRHRWPRWCRRTLKIVAGSGVLSLLGFLLIQLLLATPWIRGKVAAKVSQRVGGLEVEIASLSWTPWSGATVRGLEIKQPKSLSDLAPIPLLEVESIHAWPDYRAATKRKWRAHELTLERPRLHVSVEMLASLAAAGIPEALPPVAADDLVLNSGPLPPIPGIGIEATNFDGPEPAGSTEDGKSVDSEVVLPVLPENRPMETPDQVLEPSAPPKPESNEESAKDDPEPIGDETGKSKDQKTEPASDVPTPKKVRMRIEEGSFELIHIGRMEQLLALEGIHLDLPMFGDPKQTIGSLNLLKILGQEIDESLRIEVNCEGGRVEVVVAEDPDKASRLSGRLAVGWVAGLPVDGDLTLRMSSIGPIEIAAVAVDAGRSIARVQGGGWLLAPGTLNGVAELNANQVVGRVGGQAFPFDSASGVLQVSGGLVQSPDFRLIGDSASILGNGWVTSRDGAAVVRLVVPYEFVGMANDELIKSIPEGVFAFKPLEPDNRWFSDVSLWKEESGWSVSLGDGGSVLPLDELSAACFRDPG